MKLYLCPECKEAFESFRSFNNHWFQKHKGLPRPSREEVEVDQLPEGYTRRKKTEWKKGTPELSKEEIKVNQPLGGHVLRKEEEVEKPEKGVKANQSPEEHAPKEEAENKPKVKVYKEMEKPVDILYNILSSFPGVSEAVVDEIMSWAEYEALTPMAVGHLLNNMSGVPKGAVSVIPQKYGLALQKAAREGDAEIQMLLSGWGEAGKPPSSGAPFVPGVPFIPAYQEYRYPYQGYGYPGYPGYGYPHHGEKLAKKIEVKEGSSDEVKTLKSQYEQLLQQLQKQEEEAREEKHRREIQELRESHLREMEKAEGRYREEIARIERDRERELNEVKEVVKSLESKLSSRGEAGEEKLKAEVEDLKRELRDEKYGNLIKKIADLEKKEPTNPTELEVIQSTAREGIHALRNAGSDLKAAFMAGRVREQFPPGRRSPEERQELGKQIVESLEKDKETVSRMDQFFTKYRGE